MNSFSEPTEEVDDEHIFIHNLLLRGPPRVGKTHLIHTFTQENSSQFNNYYTPTLAIEYAAKDLYIDDNKVTLHICDISGHPLWSVFNSSGRVFPHSAAAMLVYDITDRASFEEMTSCIDQMGLQGCGSDQVPVLMVGNKADLKDQRQVGYDTAKSFADSRGLVFIETSARTGQNVEYAFVMIGLLYMKRRGKIVQALMKHHME